jgi:hypothetical protein
MIITLPSLNCITLSFTAAEVLSGAGAGAVSTFAAVSSVAALSFLASLLHAVKNPVKARRASNFFMVIYFI